MNPKGLLSIYLTWDSEESYLEILARIDEDDLKGGAKCTVISSDQRVYVTLGYENQLIMARIEDAQDLDDTWKAISVRVSKREIPDKYQIEHIKDCIISKVEGALSNPGRIEPKDVRPNAAPITNVNEIMRALRSSKILKGQIHVLQAESAA